MLFGRSGLNLGLSEICSQVVTTTSAIFFASSRPLEAPDFEWRNTFYDASEGLRVSQSRFSIVLVGVSALLRRPFVSRLRPAVFSARGSGGFRRSVSPSVSALPLGELAFGLTASAFRHAPLRGCPRRVGSSAFRFGDCRSAGWASGSRFGVALGGLAFGRTAAAFGTHRFGVAARRVGLRAHDFRFSARTASELPLGGLAFGLTASAFRHAPLRSCCSAGWPSGSPLPLFGMRRSAPPCRRREGRRSTPTRHLFHFKTLIPTC